MIELQDSSSSRLQQQQMQLQEEAELKALQEQEQSIKQLEVLLKVYTFNSYNLIHIVFRVI